MDRHPIPPAELRLQPFQAFDKRWFLLTAGTFTPGGFNTMTVSWGALGTIWNRPFAMVLVRPTRHTYRFMEAGDGFTLSLFPETYRDRLQVCGTRSGRDTDKVALTGLTPVPSHHVQAPAFDEAELILECRRDYRGDIDPAGFLDPGIHGLYKGDHHRLWFGAVLAVHGTDAWRVPAGS